MYAIYWKSRITGYVGHGDALFTKRAAQAMADQNKDHFPELEHWADTVPPTEHTDKPEATHAETH